MVAIRTPWSLLKHSPIITVIAVVGVVVVGVVAVGVVASSSTRARAKVAGVGLPSAPPGPSLSVPHTTYIPPWGCVGSGSHGSGSGRSGRDVLCRANSSSSSSTSTSASASSIGSGCVGRIALFALFRGRMGVITTLRGVDVDLAHTVKMSLKGCVISDVLQRA